MPAEALRAAVNEAHRRGSLAFAHPSNLEGLLNAVRGGVDILAQTAPQAGPWDSALLSEMTVAGVAVIPTLKPARFGDSKRLGRWN